jgi:hypothetical protein
MHATNCTTKLNDHVHEARKIWRPKFKVVCKRTSRNGNITQRQALLLNFVRFWRLAHRLPMVARHPARRTRDVREPSGKTSCATTWQRPGNGQTVASAMLVSVREPSGKTTGEMSRGIAAQRAGNGRTVANATPPNVCQGDSQDNLPGTRNARASDLQETCETHRNTTRNGHAMAEATSRKLLAGFLRSAFNHACQKL